MDDKLCIVQFIHPGGEHWQDRETAGWKNWNRGKHKRKFLRQTGKYVVDSEVKEGEMLFWGEWEPESQVQPIVNPISHGPHFVHEPHYVVRESYQGLQNTDPFVFGKHFHYTLCQQRHRNQLRHLSRGSVILFGSCEDRSTFVLDTVLVVGDRWIDHSRGNYRKVLRTIPKEYEEVTICPMYQERGTGTPCTIEDKSCGSADRQETWRLYFGASHDSPVQGMYSFFPCPPYDAKSKGFARPRIRLQGRITDNLNQGVKCSDEKHGERLSLDTIVRLWDEVAVQVKEAGLALGVCARMPERRIRAR